MEVDDIHVALEYKKGDMWGEYTTPRSNRFVLTSGWFSENVHQSVT